MATPRSSDILATLLAQLRAKTEEGRTQAAKDLRVYVDAKSQELSGEVFSRFLLDVIKRLGDLSISADINERLGSIKAIDELIEVQCDDNASKVLRFAGYLRQILGQQSDTAVIVDTTRALGHLARMGGSMTADFVEMEAKRALERLQENRAEVRRLAAVLVVKELATNAPTLFYVYVKDFFGCMWVALRDSKLMIRDRAVDALAACLTLISQRDSGLRQQWYTVIFDQARAGLRSNSADSLHGSLLVLRELFHHSVGFMDQASSQDRSVAQKNFEEVCEQVLHFRDHKDRLVRRAVIELMPKLAFFEPDTFRRSSYKVCLTHLLGVINVKTNIEERAAGFIALGETAKVVGNGSMTLLTDLSSIVVQLKESLNSRKRAQYCPEAVLCVASLAEALTDSLTEDIDDLLDQMLGGGLTIELTEALSRIVKALPSKLEIVQTSLLDVLSIALTGTGFRKPGAPAMSSSATATAIHRRTGSLQRDSATAVDSENEIVLLALRTLGTFNFDKHNLVEFVQDTIVDFLEDDNANVRMEAAKTCCRLILPNEIPKRLIQQQPATGPSSGSAQGIVSLAQLGPKRGHATAIVSAVLERLLVVGIADPDPLVRLTVLRALEPKFDPYLAQASCVRSLFTALNDESFEIRECVITIIGRLSIRNPAYVMPSLRKTLIQLLTELNYLGDPRRKEESAKLLGNLVRSSQRLIRPYVTPILRALVPKLRDPHPGVSACVLSTLGWLARVGGQEMTQCMDDLMPLIVEMLQDQSSSTRRESALCTLSELVVSTGYVVQPYKQYANLLPILLNLLKTEQTPHLRVQVIKALGVLGALDPYKHKEIQLKLLAAPPTPKGSGASGQNGQNGQQAAVGGAGGVGGGADGGGAQNNAGGQQGAGGAGADGAGGASDDDYTTLAPSSKDYYPTMAIGALMRILRDPTLSAHHQMVVEAVMFIFKSLGMKCVPYLDQVVPPFLQVIRNTDPINATTVREFFFVQLGILISIVRQHIRRFLDQIFALIHDNWDTTMVLQNIALVETICQALQDEFKVHLPTLISPLLNVLQRTHDATLKVLHALETFGSNLEDYLYLVVPPVVSLCKNPESPINVRVDAIKLLAKLCSYLDFSDLASRVIHPMAQLLEAPQPELRDQAILCLCNLAKQLGADYAIFIPTVHKIMTRARVQHPRYDRIVGEILRLDTVDSSIGSLVGYSDVDESPRQSTSSAIVSTQDELVISGQSGATGGVGGGNGGNGGVGDIGVGQARRLHVNQHNLKKAWEASQRITKEDWTEWMRRFSMELLRESPSPALRSCNSLAQVYNNLARELFNVAFVSCWNELLPQFQDSLVRELEVAFQAPNIPPEILQQLLNLAEFMEHDDKALPIESRMLSSLAEHCHAYAKALHYKELEFQTSPAATIESLISINTHLGQHESALGVLDYAQRLHRIELNESWYEKLQQWDKALEVHERKAVDHPLNFDITLARLRCYNSLGEWDKLYQLSIDAWPSANQSQRRKLSPMMAWASLHRMDWDSLVRAVSEMTQSSYEKSFFSSIIAIRQDQFDDAQHCIERCRQLLDTELTALVGESYDRAYTQMVRVQQLAELQEVILFKESGSDPARQVMIHKMWNTRLHGCQQEVEVWVDVLAIRWLVIKPQADIPTYLKLASICRRNHRVALAEKNLREVCKRTTLPFQISPLSEDAHKFLFANQGLVESTNVTPNTPITDPRVCYGLIKHMWSADLHTDALLAIQELIRVLNGMSGTMLPLLGEPADSVDALLAKTHLKYGDWLLQQEGINTKTIAKALKSLQRATELSPKSYKAWHAWAFMNFQIVVWADNASKRKGAPTKHHRHPHHHDSHEPGDEFDASKHLAPAVRGFIQSIALGGQGSLQDILRLLTLWFTHGADQSVDAALREGLPTVSIDTWLEVIPQLIARIETPVANIRVAVHDLLSRVALEHPQALVYSLAVSCKSQSNSRQAAATEILDRMRKHSGKLVEQALLVSAELIRVAILWHEQWHEGLEEASQLYFSDHNIKGMLDRLEPLHKMMEKGAETMREVSFQQAFGRDLHEAYDWCLKYKRSKNDADLNQAWEIYYRVFRLINKQLPQLTSLELQYCSPKLLAASDLDLAVPGTYRSGKPVVRIRSFSPTLSIIPSKQRPRKLAILGCDGSTYNFLLKGHEDLRQDERVMQLFGLVNTLLANSPETSRHDLSIQRYGVIPLSPNSGLIEWVPHCDTLHALVREYRESRKIVSNIEHRLMLQMAPNLDQLTVIQKVEAFEYALESTTGQDLCKVLWLKSRSSEVWLDRRTNYTRSLAVMSMVGYILGLGDRHPSNLMLDRRSGKIQHIDFGDCFEVAMNRERFPEKIPFRLTRMLIKAMEVSGIEGNFRSTCERVMRVLRENKDSAMAMLEAFVHDPLINWRLLNTASPRQRAQQQPNQQQQQGAAANTGNTTPAPSSVSVASSVKGMNQLLAVEPSSPAQNAGGQNAHSTTSSRTGGSKVVPTPSGGDGGETSVVGSARFDGKRTGEGTHHSTEDESDYGSGKKEILNQKAVEVINRVESKLKGTDFGHGILKVEDQVQKLIEQATSHENLSQLYIGWCPFW